MRLTDAEIARREQDEDAVVEAVEHVELPVRGHVVDAGVRARVRGEDDALVDADREAIGHGGGLLGRM